MLNAAARLIYSVRKYDHVTPLLRDLHWLRVPERIAFRLATLAYRCQHGTAPHYLAVELLRVRDIEYRQRLRSASRNALAIQSTNHVTIGDRVQCCHNTSVEQFAACIAFLVIFGNIPIQTED